MERSSKTGTVSRSLRILNFIPKFDHIGRTLAHPVPHSNLARVQLDAGPPLLNGQIEDGATFLGPRLSSKCENVFPGP